MPRSRIKSNDGISRPIVDEWFWSGEDLKDHNPIMAGWAVRSVRSWVENAMYARALQQTSDNSHILWLFEPSKIMLQDRIQSTLRYMHSQNMLFDETWLCHLTQRVGLDDMLQPALEVYKELGVVPRIGYLSSRRKANSLFSDFWIPGDKLYLAKHLLGDMTYTRRVHFYHTGDASIYRHFNTWQTQQHDFFKGCIIQRGYFRAPSKDRIDLEARCHDQLL